MIIRCALTSILLTGLATMVHATQNSCETTQTELENTAVQLEKQQSALIKLGAEVNNAGEDWENATAISHLSAANTKESDTLRGRFIDMKASFDTQQKALSLAVNSFNAKIADFNARCAPEKK